MILLTIPMTSPCKSNTDCRSCRCLRLRRFAGTQPPCRYRSSYRVCGAH
jgi:hypothetical protein